MSNEDYLKAIFYCEQIELALNEIAKAVGHCGMDDFFSCDNKAGELCQS